MLHVFTDSDITLGGISYLAGDEVFAFIPGDLLPSLQEYGDPQTHRYTVDGSPALYRSQTKSDGTHYDQTLIFGERSGGRNYWALDVSQPNPADWKVKWHIQGGAGGTPDLKNWATHGTSLSSPGSRPASTKEVVIFAGGYDTMKEVPEG
jgi:Tfp pilus tip-associated adhesin PilY1